MAKDNSSAAGAAPIASVQVGPGAWRVGYSDGSGEEYILDGKGEAIATIRWGCGCCKSTRPLDAEEIARARLIAAAPDLLEALTELMAMLRKEAPGTPLNNHRFDALGIKANNAIKRATKD